MGVWIFIYFVNSLKQFIIYRDCSWMNKVHVHSMFNVDQTVD